MRSKSRFWLNDFSFRRGRVFIRDTGVDITLDRQLISDVLVWFGYHLVVRAKSWWTGSSQRRRRTIWFEPDQPRPWYLVWSALSWAGFRVASRPETADLHFAFRDATWMAPIALPAINSRCLDISKARVAAVFEDVFGYPLAVDPSVWQGKAVVKSEANGVHDGAVVVCPTRALAGKHYQRLVDTSDGAFSYDLRTLCVGGAPVAVWIKRKHAGESFSIQNLSVTLHCPRDVFSTDELDQIARFLEAMGVDWAGLDILRDRVSRRIYVVDVNKTDVGPPVALSLGDKIRSTRILAMALKALVESASPLLRAAPTPPGVRRKHLGQNDEGRH